ncbi:MAG TPA: hypothetical protein VMN57_04880 [Anaerolineales bacterium]|nr:hypothetical protein [Anaerolineales bacterium]
MGEDKPIPKATSEYLEAVAPESLAFTDDSIRFPETVLYPLTLRAEGLPGLPQRPWSRLEAEDLIGGGPAVVSLALVREPPEVLQRSLRARRTLFEGVLLALAEKTGRRPSQAEQAADRALDEAESRLAMGEPAFRAALLVGLFASHDRSHEAESERQRLTAHLRARGFRVQRLMYVPERALLHFQPGGVLFPSVHEPVLMLDEAARIAPRPGRRVDPPPDAAFLGSALRDGRDVYYSLKHGFETGAPQPPHATTVLLGEMGSGKTSLMRTILLQRLLQGRSVVSLDPEGENNRLCLAAGGRVIPAGQPEDPGTCLLHPLEADSAGELLFAVRFLVSALDPGGKLPPVAQAAVHDIVQAYWRDHPGQLLPLSRLVRDLKALAGAETEAVAALLRPFEAGGLWAGFFDRPEALLQKEMFTAESRGSWWNFDLSGLREENKAIVHALLTWFLYRVISVPEAPVDVFLDEGWRLLRSPGFAGLLDELGRRARKRGMGVMLATHLPEDLAASPTSLALASTAFIGRLGPAGAEAFLAGLGIPAEEAEAHAGRIARLPPHVFYAVPGGGRGSLFPFRVQLPPAWLETWGRLGAAR